MLGGGLVDADGPLLGAVFYPAQDQLWVGGRNRPTTLNGEPVPTLTDVALAEISVATYFHPRRFRDADQIAAWRAAVSSAATVRMLGSASIDLAGVASGRLGVFLQANLHPWDWYPGAALVRGAGGVAEVVQSRRQLLADRRQCPSSGRDGRRPAQCGKPMIATWARRRGSPSRTPLAGFPQMAREVTGGKG